jgi:flavin-dependent dehydrogenase
MTVRHDPADVGPPGARYDVIIVGARVAGAATALVAARAGLRVLVLDRGDPGTDTLSTHALTRAGVLQLLRLGVLEDLIRQGTPAIRRTTFHYLDETEAVEIRPQAGVDALYAPRRTVLDPVLAEAAAAAGAEVRHGCRVTALLGGDGGRIEGVRFRDGRHGTDHEARSAITVGADGIRSIVAREVQAAAYWSQPQAGAMLYAHFVDPGVDGYHWWYRPNATAGVIPTNDGQVCVWVGTPAQRFMDELRGDPAAAFTRLLAEAAPEFGVVFDPSNAEGRVFGYPGEPGYMRTSWGSGWALVGDAGYFKDPLTAHGITDALRDAESLAKAIVATVGDRGSVPDYQRDRDRLSLDFAAVTSRIASYQWNTETIKQLVREEGRLLAQEAEALAGRSHL